MVESKEKGRRFWCELPPELQKHIASFLCGGDSFVLRRLVSKSLMYNLAATPSRSISILPEHELPYLLSLQEDNVFKFYHPLFPGFYRTQIPQLPEAQIRFSNHGWLLMSTCDRDFFFLDPISKVRVQLPKCDHRTFHLASMCFSSPPSSSDCFVIAVEFPGLHYLIIKRGQPSWTRLSFTNRRPFLPSHGVAPLLHNGSCYCLGDDGRLAGFDLHDHSPKWRFIGNSYSETAKESISQCFLLPRNRGELLRVSVGREDKYIEFTNFNIRKRTWMLDQSLGKKLLFLSRGASFVESSHLRGTLNKAYLPRLHNDAHVFYSLSAKRYLSFRGDYSSNNCFRDVKDVFYSSVWIKPNHSVTGQSFEW